MEVEGEFQCVCRLHPLLLLPWHKRRGLAVLPLGKSEGALSHSRVFGSKSDCQEDSYTLRILATRQVIVSFGLQSLPPLLGSSLPARGGYFLPLLGTFRSTIALVAKRDISQLVKVLPSLHEVFRNIVLAIGCFVPGLYIREREGRGARHLFPSLLLPLGS